MSCAFQCNDPLMIATPCIRFNVDLRQYRPFAVYQKYWKYCGATVELRALNGLSEG